jgi:hypothetical protein
MFTFDSLRTVRSSLEDFGAALFFGCGDFFFELFFSVPGLVLRTRSLCFNLGATEFANSESALLLISFFCFIDFTLSLLRVERRTELVSFFSSTCSFLLLTLKSPIWTSLSYLHSFIVVVAFVDLPDLGRLFVSDFFLHAFLDRFERDGLSLFLLRGVLASFALTLTFACLCGTIFTGCSL